MKLGGTMELGIGGGLRLEDSHLSKKPEGLPEEEMN